MALLIATAALLGAPVTGFAAGRPAPPPAASAAVASAAAPTADPALASRLATAIDRLRTHQGLPRLAVDARRVGAAASYRAMDAARERQVATTTSDGLTIDDLLLDAGVRYVRAGDALVITTLGASGQDPLPSLLVTLLADPAQRAVVLDPGADAAGVAVVRRPGSGVAAAADGDAGDGMLVASVVAIRRDGPAAPVLTARPAAHGGAVVGLRPDGAGRATVVVTDRAGTLLRILAWDRRVGGPVSLAWDGRLSDGRSAPAGTYQVRAFTVDAEGRASDPAVAEVGTHR